MASRFAPFYRPPFQRLCERVWMTKHMFKTGAMVVHLPSGKLHKVKRLVEDATKYIVNGGIELCATELRLASEHEVADTKKHTMLQTNPILNAVVEVPKRVYIIAAPTLYNNAITPSLSRIRFRPPLSHAVNIQAC